MAIRIGVIGTGNIGQDHIRRITHGLAGGSVAAMTDINPARAQKIAKGLGHKKSKDMGTVFLDVQNFSGKRFRNASFQVKRREILGVAGLTGAGRTELMEAILDEPTRGIDVGAESEIYRLMTEFVRSDKAITMLVGTTRSSWDE